MHCGCRQTPRCTGEAETILLHLAASTQTKRRRPSSESLLGGFLRATGGRAWHADGDFYRIGKGKRVSRPYLDRDVVRQALQEQVNEPRRMRRAPR